MKITSFQTTHNSLKTLTLASKFQREKLQERLSQERLFQILDPLLFSDVFPSFSSETGAHKQFLATQRQNEYTC